MIFKKIAVAQEYGTDTSDPDVQSALIGADFFVSVAEERPYEIIN